MLDEGQHRVSCSCCQPAGHVDLHVVLVCPDGHITRHTLRSARALVKSTCNICTQILESNPLKSLKLFRELRTKSYSKERFKRIQQLCAFLSWSSVPTSCACQSCSGTAHLATSHAEGLLSASAVQANMDI